MSSKPSLAVILVAVGATSGSWVGLGGHAQPAAVRPLFSLASPTTAPFPSDWFTQPDDAQLTGRRVHLPLPQDCVASASECDDLRVLNQLDGFHQHPRVSIPFDGDIDPTSVKGHVMLVPLPTRSHDAAVSCDRPEEVIESDSHIGAVVGVDQVVWDVATKTLHARADAALLEHTRYALVVTRRVSDARGNPIQANEAFARSASELCASSEAHPRWYGNELLWTEWAARRAGIQREDVAAASVFTTQSATYMAQRIRESVVADAVPARADFALGEGGAPTVFNWAEIGSITLERETQVGAELSPWQAMIRPLQVVPGAVGRVAFGRYDSPDFRAHPGEYIPPVATRTGKVTRTGTETVYFNLLLPAGLPPARGWPVVIIGHGSGGHKNFAVGSSTPYPAARGMAVIMINAASHGFGSRSMLRVVQTDGTSVRFSAGGRSTDQNRDGEITVDEGFVASSGYDIRDRYDGFLQTMADLTQLVRVIGAGIDVDEDGRPELDATRITYWGWSNGSMYGTSFVAMNPEINAAVFSTIAAPVTEHRRLSPVARPLLGQTLARRRPSLLNPEHGIEQVDGMPMPAPHFNENQPLRGEPPVVNRVPGAMAIQQYLERVAWAGRYGDAAAYIPLLRLRPPAGSPPRPVLIQLGRGDQRAQNPASAEVIRAGALEDRTVLFRFDRFYPTLDPKSRQDIVIKQAHWFFNAIWLAPLQPIAIGAHEQAVQFLLSPDGPLPVPRHPEYWEVPVKSLPGTLGYIK